MFTRIWVWLIEPNRLIAAATAVIAIVGIFQWRILSSTLDATKQAADAAVTQSQATDAELKSSHRPWAALVEPPRVVNPLTFDNEGAHVEISYKVTNGGTSPAIATTTLTGQFRIMPRGTTEQIINFVRGDPQWNCDPRMATVFSKQFNFGLMLLPQAVGNTGPTKLLAQKKDFVLDKNGSVSAIVTGCVVYHDEFGITHGTSFAEIYANANGVQDFVPTGVIQGHFQELGFAKAY